MKTDGLVTPYVLWRTSWHLGWKWFFRGIEYTRCAEYPIALQAAALRPGDRILDVGAAPFSLLTLYLASTERYQIDCVDISPYVKDLRNNLARLAKRNWTVSRHDARQLAFAEQSFDRVLAVSTIEHIPDDGDQAAMHDFARVLRRGGRAVVTVPYGTHFEEELADESRLQAFLPTAGFSELFRRRTGRRAFFQRRYDDRAITERLLAVDTLRLVERRFFGEPLVTLRHVWAARPALVKAATNWVSPILASVFLRELRESDRAKAEAVVLVLERV